MTDWTAPLTWGATKVNDNLLNTEIRDNVLNLKSPATASYSYSYSASSYKNTNSTSWVAMGSPLSLSLETFGGDIFMVFNAIVNNAYLDFAIDGQRVGGNDGLMISASAGAGQSVMMPFLYQNLPAGTHTFDIYWKVPSSNGTLHEEVPPQFYVREIS